MALRSVMTTLAIATLLAAPAAADQRERHRQNDTSQQSEQQPAPARTRGESARTGSASGDHAVPRTEPRREAQRATPAPPAPAAPAAPRQQAQARQDVSRQDQARVAPQLRADDNRRYDNARPYDNSHAYNNGRYDNHGYGYGSRRYDSHSHYYYYYAAPRYVRPTVIRVLPYQPYVYHPSFSLGVYYGSGGYYPYGYTPRGYYEPIPGRPYGGVRITGAPRDARVFADGYFVGIVDDFDGIFQHVNLEAGPHHVEVVWGDYQPIAFDVYVRPGETTTFRADDYFRY